MWPWNRCLVERAAPVDELRCVALQGTDARTAKGEGWLADVAAKVVAGGDAVGGVVQGQRVVLPIVVLQQLTVGLTSREKGQPCLHEAH